MNLAITPVINAIRVLERFVPDGELLFDAAIHDPAHARHRTGSLGNHAIAVRVEVFVAWWSSLDTCGGRWGAWFSRLCPCRWLRYS
ncbi:hypothetical protein ABZ069_35890, partial [Streptomyces microflavus]|uniref:hypothetical protein n=1 Tax=Streptomyces microflavus TaxID=1919 RepID=UPI0033B49D82